MSAPLVLITGSTRGIGRGIADHLHAGGSWVLVNGRDTERVERVVADGGFAGGVAAELTEPDQVDALRDEVLRRWGVPDGVVLNAGGTAVPPGPLEELAPADWDRAVRDNLTSAFLTVRAFLPAMKQHGGGAFVAVSSSVTRRAHVRSPVGYAAAKAGLESLMRSVAVQAGPDGVRANSVVPETIMTERNEQQIPAEIRDDLIAAHPVRRLGTVQDVAEAVAFLLSPASGWITGEALGITGGS